MINIGLLAYSSDTGLGIQTLEFYNHMKPTKTLVIDLSMYNGMATHHERYPDARIHKGWPDNESMSWLLEGMDVVFVAETPLNYHLFRRAKSLNVLTIQQYNYEFLDYFRSPDLAPPSILGAPSTWNTDIVKKLNIAPVQDWPVPVNRKKIPFREITECKTFVNIIGRPAIADRNGTTAFLTAAKRLGSKFNYIVYLQSPTDPKAKAYFRPVRRFLNIMQKHSYLKVIEDVPDYEDIYKLGDVLVIPRKYGGLCLPMQEALSAGMPVIMTDIQPNNDRLPPEWLVPAAKMGSFKAHTDIDIYEPDVEYLVEVMNRFENDAFMECSNREADDLADAMSWKNLKDKQLEWMQNLLIK